MVRSQGSDGALAVTAILLPPGLTVPGDQIAAKANEGTVRVQAALEAALGTTTLGLQAKGKIRDSDQTIAVPAVTLAVVRPASVELATAALEVKPGTTAELKGKIVRKGTFNEPVTVRINGLPAGLKADPVAVAGRFRRFRGEGRRRSEGGRHLGRCAGRPGVPGPEEGLPGPPHAPRGQDPSVQVVFGAVTPSQVGPGRMPTMCRAHVSQRLNPSGALILSLGLMLSA